MPLAPYQPPLQLPPKKTTNLVTDLLLRLRRLCCRLLPQPPPPLPAAPRSVLPRLLLRLPGRGISPAPRLVQGGNSCRPPPHLLRDGARRLLLPLRPLLPLLRLLRLIPGRPRLVLLLALSSVTLEMVMRARSRRATRGYQDWAGSSGSSKHVTFRCKTKQTREPHLQRDGRLPHERGARLGCPQLNVCRQHADGRLGRRLSQRGDDRDAAEPLLSLAKVRTR